MQRIFHWLGVVALLVAAGAASAQDQTAPPPSAAPAAPTFTPEELEQLAAPIALYPDSLLAQVLMASTYPLEVVQAQRWRKENPDLKEQALEDAVRSQPWDESVKSLTAFPPVLDMMNEKLDWTQKLGDAFLAQQDDLMDAVQRLRNKAHAEGNLESNEQQKVTVEEAPAGAAPPSAGPPQQTIIIEQANPQVVYVPTYNPTVVYGAWPYPAYPPYSYYPPGYMMASNMMSFGMGMWAGAALWGDCDWNDGGGGDKVKIDIDKYNNFNKTDIKNGKWDHKPEHRKGAQYRDQRTQNKYGKGDRPGAANREAFRGRAEQGRRDIARQGPSNVQRDIGKGGSQRPSAGNLGSGGAGQRQSAGQRPSAGNRASGGASRGSMDRGRSPGGFEGVGSGNQVRRESSRGMSSRSSAGMGSRSGGGGGRGGRGGGGGRR